MLPELAGTLAMLAGRTMKVPEPTVRNPDPVMCVMWERVPTLMELLQ